LSLWRSSLIAGARRAVSSWRLLAGLWLLNLAVALPAALVVGQSVRDAVGRSLVAEELGRGFDLRWYGEYEARAKGLETTLRPTVAGAGAFLDNLEGLWSGSLFDGFRGLVALGILYALVWTFLLGGVLERLCRPGSGVSFWAAAARRFPRFLALALLAGALYLGLYRLARRVFPWIEEATRDATAERVVLFWNLLAAAVLVTLLLLVRAACDCARIALVLDERRGLWRGAARGAGFVLRRPLAVLGLVAATGLAGALGLAVYAWLAPVAGPTTALGVGAAFVWGQAAVSFRIALRLVLLGSEAALLSSASPTAFAGY
jgi:hypothetical protein